MIATKSAEPVPLATDANGTVRVGGTRVTLDTLVAAFQDGATAEEIAQQYPTLQLADVYATISYYLRHRFDVENYLADRQARAAAIRQTTELKSDLHAIRARLVARRKPSA
jgi:uncharacterized protein (DUF433 family)